MHGPCSMRRPGSLQGAGSWSLARSSRKEHGEEPGAQRPTEGAGRAHHTVPEAPACGSLTDHWQRGTCLASELSSDHQTLSWVAGCETLTSGSKHLSVWLFGSKSKHLPGSTKGSPPEEAVFPRVWGGWRATEGDSLGSYLPGQLGEQLVTEVPSLQSLCHLHGPVGLAPGNGHLARPL